MAFCRNCGNEIREGVKFCPVCGEEIRGDLSKPDNSKRTANKVEEIVSSETVRDVQEKARQTGNWYVLNWKRLGDGDWKEAGLKHHLAWVGIHVGIILLLIFAVAGSRMISKVNKSQETSKIVADSADNEISETRLRVADRSDFELVTDHVDAYSEAGDSVSTQADTDSSINKPKSVENEVETTQQKTKEAIRFESLAGVWATSTYGTGMVQGDRIKPGGENRNKEKAMYIMPDGSVYTYNIYVWDLAYCKYQWAGDNTVSIELGSPYTSVPVDLTYELVGDKLYINIGSTACWMKKLGDDSQLFYDFVHEYGY